MGLWLLPLSESKQRSNLGFARGSARVKILVDMAPQQPAVVIVSRYEAQIHTSGQERIGID